MLARIFLFISYFAFVGVSYANTTIDTSDFRTTEQILAALYKHNQTNTDCSNKIFKDALENNSSKVSESDSEQTVRGWVLNTIFQPDVLERVLECPEITSVNETSTVYFAPIIYDFPNGRNLTINYNAQPKTLKQRLLLSQKPSVPNGNPNPRLMDPNDPAKYMNTEPAWYGIMVVQHGSLDNFVGPGKNNTVSLRYLEDNIDRIYPHGAFCTSKSAMALDSKTINKVVKEVVAVDGDSNDYYVAGDVNLEWVMYAEMAGDVLLTVLTAGTGEGLLWLTKSARAGNAAKNIKKSLNILRKDEKVIEYVKVTNQIRKNEDAISKIDKLGKEFRELRKQYQRALSAGKTAEADELMHKMAKISNEMKSLNNKDISIVSSLTTEEKSAQQIEKLQEEIKELSKHAKELSKAHKSVRTYEETAKQLGNFNDYRRALNSMRRPQTGNVITRGLRTLRYADKGADIMNDAGKVARAGMSTRSAKINDWLFDATLKHGSRLARFERDVGLFYGMASLFFDLYDRTSSTSKQFSNGIEFKPLCLLFADNLKGEENEVNYGMWLMWTGDAIDPSIDDAAYLQAMDFASKFSYTLNEYQAENSHNCDVDIFVVRPIIRIDETNENNPSGEMFYLFMNEIPWTSVN